VLMLSICETASLKLTQMCKKVEVKKLTYIHYLCRLAPAPLILLIRACEL
jgi:hypothetical protein